VHLIFSLIYAPFVFLALRYFDIKIVSIGIFIISIFWLFIIKEKKYFTLLLPIFYIFISILTYFSEEFLILKVMPLLISTLFSLYLLLSYLKKESIILYFSEKFSTTRISEDEKNYIHNSTLFWFAITLINIVIHLSMFLEENLNFWLYYSSIGWYFLFIFAGVLQFIHRKFIFLRKSNV